MRVVDPTIPAVQISEDQRENIDTGMSSYQGSDIQIKPLMPGNQLNFGVSPELYSPELLVMMDQVYQSPKGSIRSKKLNNTIDSKYRNNIKKVLN